MHNELMNHQSSHVFDGATLSHQCENTLMSGNFFSSLEDKYREERRAIRGGEEFLFFARGYDIKRRFVTGRLSAASAPLSYYDSSSTVLFGQPF